jgi:hypothetical protein
VILNLCKKYQTWILVDNFVFSARSVGCLFNCPLLCSHPA